MQILSPISIPILSAESIDDYDIDTFAKSIGDTFSATDTCNYCTITTSISGNFKSYLAQSVPSNLPPPNILEKIIWELMTKSILGAGYTCCQSTISSKAVKEKQTTKN